MNKTLNSSLSILASSEEQRKNHLALGLFCFQQQPDVLEFLIHYFFTIADSTFDDWDLVPEWKADLMIKFEWDRPLSDELKLQMTVLRKMVAVDELTALIQKWLPDRHQTIWGTLIMLKYCSQMVQVALDLDKGYEGWNIIDQTMSVMQHEYAKF